jgi:hypothetical protein
MEAGLTMPATRKIMLIRHGEKPKIPPPPQGIDENGNVDAESLTTRGWQRARLLVSLFNPDNGGVRNGLARPTALFASKINDEHGKRPVETLKPLAATLRLPIDQSYSGTKIGSRVKQATAGGLILALGYDTSEIPDLVKAITTTAGSVLAAWRRTDLPLIASHIAPGATIPNHWPGKRYDVVWVFDLNDDGATYRFSQVPQFLFPSDLATPI